MTERANKRNLIEKNLKPKVPQAVGLRLPFWFSTANYYVLAVAVSIAAFFLVWGILLEGKDEIPWITAGIIASLILISAVGLRGVFLRKMQRRRLLEQRQINVNFKYVKRSAAESNLNKLTIEKNNLILEEIEKKSKAARILEKLPEGHLEVFELCEEYLRKNQFELETVGVGSPRLPILRKSREKVERFHKYHLLSWASLESRLLLQEAKTQATLAEKVAYSQKASSVLDSAIQFYPQESILTDSLGAVKEFIISAKVGHWVEQAERAAYKKNYKRAVNHYRDALYFLAREDDRTLEKDAIAAKINAEIQKINDLRTDE